MHLLRTAFKIGEKVAIGLTSDSMLTQKKRGALIQSYKERRQALAEFINSECGPHRCTIFPIETKEGGADKMEDLEALVVSDEIGVVQMAFNINVLRAKNNIPRFHIVVVPRVRTKDGRPLSSSRIRDGELFTDEELVY